MDIHCLSLLGCHQQQPLKMMGPVRVGMHLCVSNWTFPKYLYYSDFVRKKETCLEREDDM
jgi:hypothetical protein